MLKISAGHSEEPSERAYAAGILFSRDKMLAVQTGQGVFVVDEVQPAGKRRMTGQEFLSGHPAAIAVTLGRR